MRYNTSKDPFIDYFGHSQDEAQGIGFGEIFRDLWANKWTLLIVASVAYLIASVHASTLPPVYRTSALLQITQQSHSFAGPQEFSMGFDRRNLISTEMKLITSYPVLSTVIDEFKHGYSVTPHYFPYFGAAIARLHDGEGLAEPLLGLDEYAWGGEILELGSFDVSGRLRGLSSEWKLTTGDNQEFSIWSEDGDLVLSGKTGEIAAGAYQDSLVKISVSRLHARPGTWFKIKPIPSVSSVASLAGSLSVSSDSDLHFDDIGLINISMEGSDPIIITEIVNAVARTYVKQSLANQSKEIQQKLDFIDDQLPVLKAKLDAAQLSLQQFRQNEETVDLELETQNAISLLNDYKKEIAELQKKQVDLKRRFTPTHPEVEVISRQIEKIEEKHQEVKSLLHAIPEREWEFIQKTRDVELATDLYVRLLNQAQELEVTKAGVTGNVQIVNPAMASSFPIKPNRPKIRAIGLMSGLFLGLVLLLIKRMIHNKLTDPIKLESETGLHVYASIPHSNNQFVISSRKTGNKNRKGTTGLLAFENDSDLAIEALRSFRTSMRFAMKTAENNVIIITGPTPSIGKSFFAANYAAVASKARQNVLLIDADMRRGTLHNYLLKARKPGLSEILASDVTLNEVTHEIADNFHFISSGERPPNPAELLGFDGFQELLSRAQKHYDLVVIDTPPLLLATDAGIIAQYGGQLFLLLRYGHNQMHEVQTSISISEKNGVKITGFLFNDVENEARGYGYGYSYSYK